MVKRRNSKMDPERWQQRMMIDDAGHEEGEEEEIGENGKNMPQKEREGLWSRRWW